MYTITSSLDLITTQQQVVQGFTDQVHLKLSRTQKFTDTVDYFLTKVAGITNISHVTSDPKLLEFFTAACMISQKSANHLSGVIPSIIANNIDFHKLVDSAYISQLITQYNLTAGDSLGGTMRNLIGQAAQQNLTTAIINFLKTSNITFNATPTTGKITEITYQSPNYGFCKILFDKVSPLISKSIDIIVLKGGHNLGNANDYVACGELKGGIDPAGADEHWKTAHTALQRIDNYFLQHSQNRPKLFFIGAAIETNMASEIFKLLSTNWLQAAANLAVPQQVNETLNIVLY